MKPKIFIGTMYCGEGDYLNCKNAIENQKNIDFTHFVVKDMTEKVAHDTLFSKWNDVKSTYDLFIKIDADTVLRYDTIVSEIYEFMSSDSDVTGMQIPIHDYFTDDLIFGLNCFTPEVVFNTDSHKLYCDRVDSGHKKHIKGELVPKKFIPAASHCYYATKKQAFHYGLHRLLKNQRSIISKVYNVWKACAEADSNDIRLYALMGAHYSRYFVNNYNFSYGDEEFLKSFEDAQKNAENFANQLKTSKNIF